MNKDVFKSSFARNIFYNKYALTQSETWHQRALTIVDSVTGTMGGKVSPILSKSERELLAKAITEMKFLPGGRYIYYSGREAKFYNNCYLLRGEEDTREEWAALANRVTSCLMTGGGIGVDYSEFRPEGRILSKTGGQSSGPIPLMYIINEIGRNVMQGGSRRSAIYASLNWQHEDAGKFLKVKNWKDILIHNNYSMWDAKQDNFNYPAPLDMTNISLNYDDEWLADKMNPTFLSNCRQALETGEPGFSFNFGDKQRETLRNALTSKRLH